MGFFSWNCAISNKSIPHDYQHLIHLILPNNKIVSGKYDGYGNIGDVAILDTLSEVLKLKGGAFANRGVYDVETKEEFFYTKDFKTYASVLPKYGKSVNDLVADGTLKDVKSNFDKVMEQVKIVTDYYYKNPPNSLKYITEETSRPPRFEDLPISKNCEHQGFFYPENFNNYAYGYE